MLDQRIKTLALGCLLALFGGQALAGFEEDYESKKWQELEFQLPAKPERANYLGFYVSATTDNRFFVDAKSVSIGADGVVRYTLIIETAGGANNVSFEGMRCETRERRTYAFGRSDGVWSKSRSNQWEKIREAANNRQYAALFLEYFCPGGVIVAKAEDALGLLRRGGYSPASGY